MRMTLRRKRFVDEYLIDLDGKHAAIRAGYAPRSAKQHASYLLRQAEVSTAVAAAMAARNARTGITPERVIEELARIAFADWRLLADWGPQGAALRPAAELSAAAAAPIAALIAGDGVRLKTHDKQKALATLARILGIETGAPKEARRH